MATGLPVKSEELIALSTLANQCQTSLFMAAGQKDVRITDQIKLFPQNAKKRLLALIFGNYYPPLGKGDPALIPANLFNTRAIDYFLPRSHFKRLKDSSLSVVQGLTFALNYCSYLELKAPLKLQECLKEHSHIKKAKFDSSILSIYSLQL